jgi:hypothetical protein
VTLSFSAIAYESFPLGSSAPPIEIIDSSTVIEDKEDLIPEGDDIFKLGIYKYELNSGELSALPKSQSKAGEVALQVGYDAASNRYGVLNGRILVSILNLKDPHSFASSFDLDLVYHFPEIGVLVVKVRDSKYLGQKVIELSSDASVKSVKLDIYYGDLLAQ